MGRAGFNLTNFHIGHDSNGITVHSIYTAHYRQGKRRRKKINELSKGGYLHVSASAKLGGLIVSFQ